MTQQYQFKKYEDILFDETSMIYFANLKNFDFHLECFPKRLKNGLVVTVRDIEFFLDHALSIHSHRSYKVNDNTLYNKLK